jgi:hypothetical protein
VTDRQWFCLRPLRPSLPCLFPARDLDWPLRGDDQKKQRPLFIEGGVWARLASTARTRGHAGPVPRAMVRWSLGAVCAVTHDRCNSSATGQPTNAAPPPSLRATAGALSPSIPTMGAAEQRAGSSGRNSTRCCTVSHLSGALAELERSISRERVKARLERTRAKGKALGIKNALSVIHQPRDNQSVYGPCSSTAARRATSLPPSAPPWCGAKTMRLIERAPPRRNALLAIPVDA